MFVVVVFGCFVLFDQVTLNWPRSQCRLLEADVEIMDSPGLDINDLLDSGINAYEIREKEK